MHFPLLDVLSEQDRRQLLAGARRRTFSRNEVIFHEGDLGDTMHLVNSGHVAVRIHTPLGDIATVRVVRPGEFFGELAVVSPGPRNASAVTLDAVETIAVDRGQLNDLRTGNDQVGELLLAALVTEIRRTARLLVDAMYLPAETRVWRRLQDLALIFGSDGTPADLIPLTQDEIAQLSGCTRQTANRTLRGGEEARIIRMSRGTIAIVDLDAVQRRAR